LKQRANWAGISRMEASMRFFCFNPQGFDGGLVRVEVDARRGLPAIEIIGMAGQAVREARDRVRVALRRCGRELPLGHVVVNLSPAGMPKTGAVFDLAIALAVAQALGSVAGSAGEGDAGTGDAGARREADEEAVLALGELTLSGDLCGVDAVVPALLAARQAGIRRVVLPAQNQAEAAMLAGEGVCLVSSLSEALAVLEGGAAAVGRYGMPAGSVAGAKSAAVDGQSGGSQAWAVPSASPDGGASAPWIDGGRFDAAVFERQPLLLAGLMAAATGRHHLMLYGPPGSGKTFALKYLGSLLPALDDEAMLEVNRLYSLAGRLTCAQGPIRAAPVRMPHHGSSPEALMGGGRRGQPGEISLAHKGLLILDEAPEFRSSVIQALREPMEEGVIRLGRANGSLWFPADFILGLSLNPCPCGRLGGGRGACSCAAIDVQRYWGRIGAPVTDRIDVRIPVGMAGGRQAEDDIRGDLPLPPGSGHAAILDVVGKARGRAAGNAALRGRQVDEACRMDAVAVALLEALERRDGLLARSRHSILRLAKTMADLAGRDHIDGAAMRMAIRLRAPVEALPGLPVFG
jgi:magnesium chelatase family protein